MDDREIVHVIGGGLAGLVAARTIVAAGASCVLHEASSSLGGRARTDERRGFRFNRGPHAFYLGGDAAEILAGFGVVPRGRAPRVSSTVMVRDGRSVVGPVTAGSLLRTPLLGVRGKLELARLLVGLPRIDTSGLAGATVNDWIASRTADAGVADVLRALVRLTSYVDAPDDLSAEVAVRQLQLGVGPGVVYLDGGWQQIVDALAHPHIRIARSSNLETVPDVAAAVVAVGGPATTSAVVGQPFASTLAAEASTLDLALSAPPRHPVVIGVDEPIYLSDHGFPDGMTPADRSSVSLANYLAPGVEPDRATLRAFACHAGVTDDQVLDERYLHRMTVVSSIATADTGGLEGRQRPVVDGRPGVFVAGDWVGPRGHLLDAVVSSAHAAGLAAVRHLSTRRTVR